MKLPVIVYEDRGMHVAKCHAMPGCEGRGRSRREALGVLRREVCKFLDPAIRISPELVEFVFEPIEGLGMRGRHESDAAASGSVNLDGEASQG